MGRMGRMGRMADVVLALINSRDPKQYIQRMKQRAPELGKGWVQIVYMRGVIIFRSLLRSW